MSGSVTGVVRDSAGLPQIGAEVQLLRPDLSVVTSVYTDSFGRFTIASILPGHYALKAMDTSFLPSLRENVRVRGGRTVVNLTLNTLYEVIQWLPAEPRSSNARRDDWAWTLRSAADRPLLRWLEDGPLVVLSDGSGDAAQAQSPLDGHRPGRNLRRKRRALLRHCRRHPLQQPGIAGARRFCAGHQREPWSRCSASARISAMPARFSRSPRSRFIPISMSAQRRNRSSRPP